GETPVPYLDSIAIDGFAPARSAAAHGPIFEADGYLVTLTAHDDPTGLFEIRSEMARVVTIELPASATNISLTSAKGFARASTVSFAIEGGQARLFLGTGSFSGTGRPVLADQRDRERRCGEPFGRHAHPVLHIRFGRAERVVHPPSASGDRRGGLSPVALGGVGRHRQHPAAGAATCVRCGIGSGNGRRAR